MDALARHRRTTGLAGQSINWGPWSGIGAAAARDVAQRAGLEGIGMLTPAEGMRALEHVLQSQHPQLTAVHLEWDRFPARWRKLPLFTLLDEQKKATPAAAERESNFRSRLAQAPANQRYQILLSHLQALAAQTLGVKEPASLPADQALADAGLDSLASLELSHRIEESLATPISSTFVFDYPTLHDMAGHFAQTLLETPAADLAPTSATAPTRLDDDAAMRMDDDGFRDVMDDTLDDTLDDRTADEGVTHESVSQELQELSQELDRWGQG
jgi:acyl carrier protein